ncbi:hypothetical protein D3C76_1400120 [compost metagenome]
MRWSNHHCWIGIRLNCPSAATWVTSSAVTASVFERWSKIASMVWPRIRSRSLSSIFSSPWLRTRETTCRLRIESPPNSKKLSVMPTRSTCNTSAQTSANSCSSRLRPGTYSVPLNSGSGRAWRSSLPFGVTGNASRQITWAGTM